MGTGNRPVTRKGPALKAGNGRSANGSDRPVVSVAVKATAKAVYGASDLRYGDGTVVAIDNETEITTFQRYLAIHEKPPLSKAKLLAYYRAQMTDS